MRKVRDYDAELRALASKQRALKAKRVKQLGELVVATGADSLSAELLAGTLLAAIDNKDADGEEAFVQRGRAFFQSQARPSRRRARAQPAGETERQSGGQSA